jgi:hypothetical protein
LREKEIRIKKLDFYFKNGGERIYAKARLNKIEEENKCLKKKG